ncbi:RMD1 family protein [Carboxydothermus ferrireducens]|uniref:DUF155 domain-containing protein n=1 Tax=Carboxydothermus ferrireducens DSM 11255 TaxID=1119529 RepID=A0ABX2R8H9_9THEO|nr:hypothetical protein [Carboxydothermus ferrireducens]NYE56413.1 hypothetical protein [Carboxydothermus ferrireducens DSM 11255]
MNQIFLYRLFDIAEEINLAKAEEILSEKRPFRLKLKKIPPKAIHIEEPPLIFEYSTGFYFFNGKTLHTKIAGKIFAWGVLSLNLSLDLKDLNHDEFLELMVYLNNTEEFDGLFKKEVKFLKDLLTPALIKPSPELFEEDFLIFFTTEKPNYDPVPLLLGEKEPISSTTRAEILNNRFSYADTDMTIITWDAAFVYDANGNMDVIDLLEFAVSQLLELRYYDSLLTKAINEMYQDIDQAEEERGYKKLGKYRTIMKRLLKTVADITEITERVQNALKVTEDVFYARVYSQALRIFRTNIWAEQIRHKLNVLERSYSMLSEEVVTSRFLALEITIVLLILLEFILALLPYFK